MCKSQSIKFLIITLMFPRISDLRTWPWAPASRSTLSITSRNTSFLRYLIPREGRHGQMTCGRDSLLVSKSPRPQETTTKFLCPICGKVVFLLPSGSLHETALVTAGGGLGAPTSSLYPSWVMYSWTAEYYLQDLINVSCLD